MYTAFNYNYNSLVVFTSENDKLLFVLFITMCTISEQITQYI